MHGLGVWMRAWLGIAAALATGCTTITISAGPDEVVIRSPSNPRIKVFGLAPVAIRTSGLGVSRTPHAFNLGWYSETGIYTTGREGECRIVLLSGDRDELQELLSVLQAAGTDLANVCIDRSIDQQGASR